MRKCGNCTYFITYKYCNCAADIVGRVKEDDGGCYKYTLKENNENT